MWYLIGIWEKMKSKFQHEEGQGEEGQGLVEYALLLALIAVFCIAVITSLGERVSNTFDAIRDALPSF
jgi:pilus assembly protein Flp/PilA